MEGKRRRYRRLGGLYGSADYDRDQRRRYCDERRSAQCGCNLPCHSGAKHFLAAASRLYRYSDNVFFNKRQFRHAFWCALAEGASRWLPPVGYADGMGTAQSAIGRLQLADLRHVAGEVRGQLG